MKLRISSLTLALLIYAACAVLVSGLFSQVQTFEAGKNAKITGIVQSRNGDLVTIRAKKSGATVDINLTDDTKIDRKKDFRLRHADMDVTAMVPGLTIAVEGIGNAKSQLDASKITFDPNIFNIEVAEEQQIQANQGAASIVANYPRDSANVPMRRILVPAGYGASHPAFSNQTAEGRDFNQRVDVKVIINKGIEEGAL